MAAAIFEIAVKLIFNVKIELSRKGKQQVRTHGTSLLKCTKPNRKAHCLFRKYHVGNIYQDQ